MKAMDGVNPMGEVSKVGKEFFEHLPNHFKSILKSGAAKKHLPSSLQAIRGLQKPFYAGFLTTTRHLN
jgi:hypothetical protein